MAAKAQGEGVPPVRAFGEVWPEADYGELSAGQLRNYDGLRLYELS